VFSVNLKSAALIVTLFFSLAGCSGGLKKQLDEAQSKLGETESRLTQQKIELEKAKTDLASLAAELESQKKSVSEKSKLLEAKTKELERLKKQLIDAQKLLGAVKKENQRLLSQRAVKPRSKPKPPPIDQGPDPTLGEADAPGQKKASDSLYMQGWRAGWDDGMEHDLVPPSMYSDYADGDEYARGYLDGHKDGLKASLE
jgi:uncharacterized phage infection (PIP) family protein YhgE